MKERKFKNIDDKIDGRKDNFIYSWLSTVKDEEHIILLMLDNFNWQQYYETAGYYNSTWREFYVYLTENEL